MVFDMTCARLFSILSAQLGASVPGALLSARASFDSVMALILLTAVSTLILKSFGFKGAMLVAVLAAVTLISSYGDALREVSSVFSILSSDSDVSEYVNAALKVAGISYLSGISADICREIGETGAAKTVSVVTKLELILLSVPYVKEILNALISLLNS